MSRKCLCLTLLLLGCIGCRQESFDSALTEQLNRSVGNEKTVFNQVYTYSSAREEAQEYCNKRINGKTQEDIIEENVAWQIDLTLNKKVTPDEATNLISIRNMIQVLAVDFYCPQFKEEKLPLQERIK
ncbi:MAG TPA: hypothetical protein VK184_26480 [Nostocaceae cyanobacterium]|nr:hypothetical protein [Nostocaceae cyanobacterium]